MPRFYGNINAVSVERHWYCWIGIDGVSEVNGRGSRERQLLAMVNKTG